MMKRKLIPVLCGVLALTMALTACTSTKTVTVNGHEYKTVKEHGVEYEYVDGVLQSIDGKPVETETEDDEIAKLQEELEKLKEQLTESSSEVAETTAVPESETVTETESATVQPTTEAPKPTETATTAAETTVAETTPAPNGSEISSDWEDEMEFTVDGQKFTMPCVIQTLVDNGWTCDEMSGYVVNPNSTIIGTSEFIKPDYVVSDGKYDNFKIEVGSVTNDGSTVCSYFEGKAQVIRFDRMKIPNLFEKYPDVRIAGNIGFGSTKEEVFAVFGNQPTDEYRSDELGYTVYTFETSTGRIKHVKLTIYDDSGVSEIELAYYI